MIIYNDSWCKLIIGLFILNHQIYWDFPPNKD